MKVWLLTISLGYNILFGWLYWQSYKDGMAAAYPICELQYNTLKEILIEHNLWDIIN